MSNYLSEMGEAVNGEEIDFFIATVKKNRISKLLSDGEFEANYRRDCVESGSTKAWCNTVIEEAFKRVGGRRREIPWLLIGGGVIALILITRKKK